MTAVGGNGRGGFAFDELGVERLQLLSVAVDERLELVDALRFLRVKVLDVEGGLLCVEGLELGAQVGDLLLGERALPLEPIAGFGVAAAAGAGLLDLKGELLDGRLQGADDVILLRELGFDRAELLDERGLGDALRDQSTGEGFGRGEFERLRAVGRRLRREIGRPCRTLVLERLDTQLRFGKRVVEGVEGL